MTTITKTLHATYKMKSGFYEVDLVLHHEVYGKSTIGHLHIDSIDFAAVRAMMPGVIFTEV